MAWCGNMIKGLQARAAQGKPIRVGLIGAGKFGSMYLTQARTTPGVQIAAIADLDKANAVTALEATGWAPEQFGAASMDAALRDGSTYLTEDVGELCAADIDVVVECTGAPRAGLAHARRAIREGKHVVMATVEGDVVAGPLLAQEAAAHGVCYSMAWGDQPALITEHVDWALSCGFRVASAGKGTRYHPDYHTSTPDTVWDHYVLG